MINDNLKRSLTCPCSGSLLESRVALRIMHPYKKQARAYRISCEIKTPKFKLHQPFCIYDRKLLTPQILMIHLLLTCLFILKELIWRYQFRYINYEGHTCNIYDLHSIQLPVSTATNNNNMRHQWNVWCSKKIMIDFDVGLERMLFK